MNLLEIENQEKQIKYAQLSQQQAEMRSISISDCKYRLHLEMEEHQISGLMVINFKSNFKAVVIDYCGKWITGIQVNEKKWSNEEVVQNWRKHQITINECLEENCVSIHFICQYSDNGFGLYKQHETGTYIYSLFCPNYAHSVSHDLYQCFPCFDQPSIKAEITLDVVCPADWTVISNMSSVAAEEITELKKHWRFATTPKISTYLFSLNAGNWRHSQIQLENGNQMNLYCESIKKVFLMRYLYLIKQCMDFGIKYYEQIFQIPLPFQKQDLIFCSNFYFSGMEHPGAILVSQNQLNLRTTSMKTSFLLLILHELSHMWFGNLVTMQWWNDLWLNEAFAVYISYQALEQYVKQSFQEYEDPTVHYLLYKQSGVLQDINPMTHPIDVEIQDANEGLQAFDSITYNKGSAVLCALVNQIGFERFITIVQTYLKTYSWSNATTSDLFSLIHKETNVIDISRWREEYIESNGISIIELRRQNDGVYVEQRDFHQVNKSRQHLMKILILQDNQQIPFEVSLSESSHFLGNSNFDAAILNYDDSSYCISIFDNQSLSYLLNNFKDLKLATNVKIQVLNSLFQMSYILGTFNVKQFIKFVLDQIDFSLNLEILNFIVQKSIIIYEKLTVAHKLSFGPTIFETLQPFLQYSFVADNIGLFACTAEHIHQLYLEIEHQGQQRNLSMIGKFLSCIFYRSYLMDQTLIPDYLKIWDQLKPYNAHLARQQQASLMSLTEMQQFFDNLLSEEFNVHNLEDVLKGLNNEYSRNYSEYVDTYLTYLPVLLQSTDQHRIRVLLNSGFPNQGDVEKQLEILDQLLQNHYNLQLTITKLQQTLLQRRAIQQQCQ